ncbi:TonB-dependent hemoglobin/transferrin/lactoferrin family receptor [Verminephrobacter aporrectodeae subsp. tuberculatae]|uniref:TonB-dependent hemoglobin/transferrin/lactoferrin family receptor n=1 Tax=Verminephrobacter aporrectodeae subsp. tuberculatae TaxID=1110392 RepID=A0ABT3KQM7_9BURK|nr:TonB-dependent hemoglobin/transferrin/lactoferrin family receptor [Verminephrobacter aporrectodeae]MCW5320437.1 TonB-dependent hemoglobin/transferrin/lactoferrin family receptor [Verminephrobacter aporrectodeae subsp. tuberculatae]
MDPIFPIHAWPQAWLAACACAAMGGAQAQPTAAEPVLGEVVVSGSRSAQDPDELPMSIDVINARALEEGQVRDIRDAARGLPNVSVTRSPARFSLAGGSTGREQNAGFNIRGLDGNRVLMLVDGMRLPRSYAFGANAFGRDYLDIGLLQRIEVLRGASSALYGSDGMAGLVHFITADPSAFLEAGKRLGGRVNAAYDGDDHGKRLGATVAGRAGDSLQWLLGGNLTRARALENMGENHAANADRTRPNPQKDHSGALLGKVVLTPGGGQRHVFMLEQVDKRSDHELLSARAKPPLAATSTLSSNAWTVMRRSRATWEGSWRLDTAWADGIQAALGYQDAHAREYIAEDRNTAADRVRDVTYDERSWQANLQGSKALRMGPDWAQKITYGLDYAVAKVRNLQTGVTPPAGETFPLKRFPDTTETSAALYAQDEFVRGAWSITPGVRLDAFRIRAEQSGFGAQAVSLSGSAASPKVGVSYRASPVWTVFGNLAAGFRAPNAGQVNAFFENPVGNYKTVPNGELRPEKSRNFELGVRARMDSLALRATAFTGRYKDFIEDLRRVGGAGTPGNPLVFQSVNIDRVKLDGFEVGGAMRWGTWAGGALSTPFAYGRTRGRDMATGRPVNTVDPARLTAGLRYDHSAWMLRLDATHGAAKKARDVSGAAGGAQYLTPSCTVLDLSGQWRIRRDLRLNAAIHNLTNQKYWRWADVRGLAANAAFIDAYSQPGRSLRISLVADF